MQVFKSEEQKQEEQRKWNTWQRQIYVMGTFVGGALGFFSAYLFAREAEDSMNEDEKPEVPPTVLLGLALSILSLIRQIGEVGRKK